MSDQLWYYQLLGTEMGPVSTQALLDLLSIGQLSDSDLVRSATETEWRAISSQPVLQAELINAHELADPSELMAMLVSESASGAADATGMASAADLEAMLTRESPAPAKPARQPAPLPEPVVPVRSEPRWYCRVFNQEMGPFTFSELRTMAQNGELGSLDAVRGERDPKWSQALRIPGLFSGIQAQAPIVDNAPVSSLSPQRAGLFLQWYLQTPAGEIGPFELPELQGRVDRGELTTAALVRRDGQTDWLPITSISSLKFPPPPPPPKPVAPAPAASATPPQPAAAKPPAPEPERAASSPPPPPPSRPAGPPAGAYKPAAAAPPRFTPSRPAARSSGGGGGGFSVTPQMIGIAAGVLIVPVLIWFSLPFLGKLLKTFGEDVKQVQGLLAEIEKLEKSGADDEQWKAFARSTRRTAAEHKASLKPYVTNPVAANLIKIYDTCLPKIYAGPAPDRAEAIKQMQTLLKAAADGK